MVSKEETIAVCFCGAAKTTGLGVPMVAAIWMNKDQLTINLIQIPVVLYTTEQIFLGQAMVWAFKRWQEKGEKGVDEESREEQNVVII
jgi:sodium/bile acid cotransporter 7